MRRVYSLLLTLALPIVFIRLYFKGKKNPVYRQRWKERLGFVPDVDRAQSVQKIIWIHAVSVGEVEATVPLVKKLFERYSDLKIVMTTTTPTGAETVQRRYKDQYEDKIQHFFIPYDLISFQRRFIKRIKAELLIIMETEVWPNLIHYCHSISIPIVLANARMSERSCQGYLRIKVLSKPMFAKIDALATQTEQDAQRLITLGAGKDDTFVAGSLKFDQQLPENIKKRALKLRAEIGMQRPVWVAASTHQGEEQQVLEAHHQVLKILPDCLLILVPRHPERFDDVFQLCLAEGFNTSRRSLGQKIEGDEVYLVDTMGDLLLCYGAADVALVAGSLEPIGGHNLLEPASLALPILMGPHTFKIEKIFETFLESGAAERVNNSAELADQVISFLQDNKRAVTVGTRAKEIVVRNQGATDKHVSIVERLLPQNP